jgi:hypothetical protein
MTITIRSGGSGTDQDMVKTFNYFSEQFERMKKRYRDIISIDDAI